MANYVDAQEVLGVLGGPNQSKPSSGIVQTFLDEAESAVRGSLGELPSDPRDEEIAGVIRDMAAARALYLMRAAQSNEPPRVATELADNAARRLRDLDARRATAEGLGEVDADAYSNVQTGALFSLEEFNLRETDSGVVSAEHL